MYLLCDNYCTVHKTCHALLLLHQWFLVQLWLAPLSSTNKIVLGCTCTATVTREDRFRMSTDTFKLYSVKLIYMYAHVCNV